MEYIVGWLILSVTNVVWFALILYMAKADIRVKHIIIGIFLAALGPIGTAYIVFVMILENMDTVVIQRTPEDPRPSIQKILKG